MTTIQIIILTVMFIANLGLLWLYAEVKKK